MSQPKDAATVLVELTEAKGVTAAAIGGALGYATLGLDSTQALTFGAASALATSAGDLLLTYTGAASKVETYLSNAGTGNYLDVNDFVAGGVGGLAVGYGLGYRGTEIAMVAGITALAAGVAPMVLSNILLKIAPIPASK